MDSITQFAMEIKVAYTPTDYGYNVIVGITGDEQNATVGTFDVTIFPGGKAVAKVLDIDKPIIRTESQIAKAISVSIGETVTGTIFRLLGYDKAHA